MVSCRGVCVLFAKACIFVCAHAFSSSRAPWPTDALLSDWQLAGELYDGAVSPAVSHSPGNGSPDIRSNTSECKLSHPFWIEFWVEKSQWPAWSFQLQSCPGKRNGDERRSWLYTCTLVACLTEVQYFSRKFRWKTRILWPPVANKAFRRRNRTYCCVIFLAVILQPPTPAPDLKTKSLILLICLFVLYYCRSEDLISNVTLN